MRNLWSVVLSESVNDYFCLTSGRSRDVRTYQLEAGVWFGDLGTEPYSFRWVCMLLDIDPNRILRLLGLGVEFWRTEGRESKIPMNMRRGKVGFYRCKSCGSR